MEAEAVSVSTTITAQSENSAMLPTPIFPAFSKLPIKIPFQGWQDFVGAAIAVDKGLYFLDWQNPHVFESMQQKFRLTGENQLSGKTSSVTIRL